MFSLATNNSSLAGDFQLAYPADYYTEQPTAGQQPLYDQLLLRAELAYRLGLTSLTAEDCSSLAKLDVLQPCQKIADPSKFRKYRKDQQQHRRRHGAETTRANDQTSKGDLSSLRHHRDEIFLDSENSEEVNEINLKNGENDWETLSESSDPSRGDQCTDAISPSKFGPSLYSLSQSSSESLTDLVLGYSNQMQNYSWGDEEGSRDWEGGSGGESSPRTEDEIHFESFSEKYRETRQPVEIASWSGNGNLPQLQAKVSTERKIDLGSPTRLHSQRNPSSSTQSWSICSPSKSIANPVDDEAYFTRLGDIRHAPIAPRKPQSAVKTNSPNVASRQIQSVQAEMVNGDSVHFTFLVSDNQQGNVHNCTKQDPFQTIPAQSSPTTRQSESSNHESLAYNVRLNSALNDFLSQEGDADGQSVGSSVCALTGEVFEGSDDTFPAAVMSSVKAAHCSTKGVQDILDERTNDAKTRQLEEYRNFRTSYLQAYRTAKKDAGNLPHL